MNSDRQTDLKFTSHWEGDSEKIKMRKQKKRDIFPILNQN